MKLGNLKLLGVTLMFTAMSVGPVLAQNQDLRSFGKEVHFAGHVVSGILFLSSGCGPQTPPNRCLVLAPAGTTTNFDERDMAHIRLPGGARPVTLVYQLTNMTYQYTFENSTGAVVPSAVFNAQPYVTLESNALNGVNHPITGLPLNGAIDLTITAAEIVDRSLAVGERDHQLHRFTAAGATGIGKNHLLGLGLSQAVVNDVFNGLVTYRLNIRGQTNYVTNGSVAYDLRLFVD